jgi:hypothetical protein
VKYAARLVEALLGRILSHEVTNGLNDALRGLPADAATRGDPVVVTIPEKYPRDVVEVLREPSRWSRPGTSETLASMQQPRGSRETDSRVRRTDTKRESISNTSRRAPTPLVQSVTTKARTAAPRAMMIGSAGIREDSGSGTS